MIIFTDPHLSKFNSIYGNDSLKIGIDCFKQIREYAIKNGELNITCLGDLNHLKDRIPTIVWEELFNELILWDEYGFKSYWLLGNHDFLTDKTINLLKVFKGATIITQPSVIKIEKINYNFLPYGFKYNPKFFTKDRREILLVHDFIEGVDYGYKSESGIKKNYLKDYKYIFAGHYHTPSIIIENKAWHLGSTHQTNFSEVGEKKIFAVINSDNEVEFINFNYPELIQFNYNDKDKIKVKGKYIKVIVEVKSLTSFSLRDIKNEFMNKGALGVKVEAKFIPKDKKRLKDKEVILLSDKEIADKYIKDNSEGLNKKKLLKISKEIII